MSRARKAAPAKRRKGAVIPTLVLPNRDLHALQVMKIRLHRAADVLSCFDELSRRMGSELNFGALAVCARDLIDRVQDDLATLSSQAGAP